MCYALARLSLLEFYYSLGYRRYHIIAVYHFVNKIRNQIIEGCMYFQHYIADVLNPFYYFETIECFDKSQISLIQYNHVVPKKSVAILSEQTVNRATSARGAEMPK